MSSVVLEGRTKTEVARDYGVSRRWVHTLVDRYLAGGWEALEPRSRRPRTNPRQLAAELEAQILTLRRGLSAEGHDAGAHTIAAHLERDHGSSPAPSTIWNVLARHGMITPQPKKRPRSSYLRFEAGLPNETWQSDFTHWRLAGGTDIEVLTFLDDHARLALSITCHLVVTGTTVLADFRQNVQEYGPPASTLTDNGLVFTAKYRGGKNGFENELRDLLLDPNRDYQPQKPQNALPKEDEL